MNILAYLHFTCFLFFLLFAGYLLYKNSTALLNRIAAALFLFYALWSLTTVGLSYREVSPQQLMLLVNLTSISILLSPVFTLWIILIFTEQKRIFRSHWFYAALLLTGGLIVFFQFRGDLYQTTVFLENKQIWDIKIVHPYSRYIADFYNYSCYLLCFVLLWRFWKKTTDLEKKNQARIIFYTMAAGFVGSVGAFSVYRYTELPVPNLANMFLLIVAFGLSYAIGKYELFELTPSRVANKIVEIIPEGLVLTDSDGDIIWANPGASRISGYRNSELIDKNMNFLFSQAHRQKYGAANQVPNLQGKEGEIKTKQKNHFVPVLFSVAQITDNAGRYSGSLWMLHNISERKKAIEVLKKARNDLERRVKERTAEIEKINEELRIKIYQAEIVQKTLKRAKEMAEESDRLKSAFLANISHEIRTPLNGIMGFAEVLKDEADSERQQQFLDIILLSSENLLDLVNQLVQISEIEAGLIKNEPVRFELNQLIDEIYDFARQNNPNQISISYKKSQNNEFKITCGRRHLKESLKILLQNALRFTPEGFVHFGYYTKENQIIFFVKDTGIGIPAEQQRIIFERFRQLDTANNKRFGGIGMGLAIAKGLIEIINGTIKVVSDTGKGTTFYIYLPQNPEK